VECLFIGIGSYCYIVFGFRCYGSSSVQLVCSFSFSLCVVLALVFVLVSARFFVGVLDFFYSWLWMMAFDSKTCGEVVGSGCLIFLFLL